MFILEFFNDVPDKDTKSFILAFLILSTLSYVTGFNLIVAVLARKSLLLVDVPRYRTILKLLFHMP